MHEIAALLHAAGISTSIDVRRHPAGLKESASNFFSSCCSFCAEPAYFKKLFEAYLFSLRNIDHFGKYFDMHYCWTVELKLPPFFSTAKELSCPFRTQHPVN